MIDLIKKSMFIGIGLALKTKDEVQELGRELINKEQMSENDGRKFIDDLIDRYDEAKAEIEDKIDGSVKEFLNKMDLVTQDDLKKVQKEVKELKKALAAKTENK
jgi:polyhydroxyalkanoate synthesis regulator phasin